MRLRADLIAAGVLLLAPPAVAQRARQATSPPAAAPEPEFQEPAGDGPRGSSRTAPGESRYDEVGYAAVGDSPGVAAVSSGLSSGYAEVTSLTNGKTVVVRVIPGTTPARLVSLSAAAATEIGATDATPVRVRRVTPAPQDIALLQRGQLAAKRADAPSALLIPLRKRIGAAPVTLIGTPAPVRRPATKAPLPVPGKPAPLAEAPVSPPPSAVLKPPTTQTRPAPASAVANKNNPVPRTVARDTPSGFYVQIAALSDVTRAQSLAGRIGGFIEPVGSLYRVQLGPFPDGYAAERGRAAAVREGYPDARIIRVD